MVVTFPEPTLSIKKMSASLDTVTTAAVAPAVVMANPYTTKGFPSEFCKCNMEGSCTCGKPEKSNVDKAILLDASGNLTPEMGQALCGKGWTKALRCEHGFIHCVVCPQPLASEYNYKHNVETCACGTCHKARVDSGTQEAYERKIHERSNAVVSHSRTYETVQPSLSQACLNADLAIAKATTMSGGGPDKPDFAKNLFAAMGTPHDSKCPHGLPFYACMPCSH